ncbi:hypothetical protein BD780_001846 [Clostridium tetanomorphum]|uniref:DUF378 domain-containing protein n=1 Tax=Clostridium tetanomorphum TaxID=1553 RepID=A0A923J210_CLOTT|nr:DUF378 domain-containing protein [Clostridium tetanomorphum]KAJ52529.1 hypothetical protein CTM_07566 [Clostridium tetanomorphum DSM 665]MBC2399791.1 DUF378 domain-containing protein [Clostridium tetanomorphum]MBP1864208.1 uncharacterized membrane protein YuzA (DUF378 family) [Clostridium tetanomorphum]NRS84621.1 hypothetical protein [Clostridium tetanomorphum]NRZ97836.1 hypothetical protein [Clostridium tetanomorphum]
MYKFNLFDKLSFILVIIGAINWGLLGLFNFNLVSAIFGEPANFLSRIIYILIGISGVYLILLLLRIKKYSKS